MLGAVYLRQENSAKFQTICFVYTEYFASYLKRVPIFPPPKGPFVEMGGYTFLSKPDFYYIVYYRVTTVTTVKTLTTVKTVKTVTTVKKVTTVTTVTTVTQ